MTRHKHWWLKETAGHDIHGQSIVYDELGRSVAIVYDGKSDGPLVTAAPDMLATLRAIAADCEDYLNNDLDMDAGELCQAFLAAINKVHDQATGSTFNSENPVDEYGEKVQT